MPRLVAIDRILDERKPELLDDDDPDYLSRRIREKAKDEARDAIRTSLGEYIDEEESPSAWDVGGLLKWAQRLFPVSATQNQLRKMLPAESISTI